MVRAVEQRHFDVDHRVAGEHAIAQCLFDPLLHRRDVLARHRAALDRVDELVALARLVRRELEPHVTVLAAATRLLDELALGFNLFAERLAVGHLRLANARLDAEFAPHTVDQNLEMQLAHAGDDRLARFLVGAHTERRIFLREAPERDAHLLLIRLGLRLDRLRDHRVGELHALERDDLADVAQRLAGRNVLQAYRSRDITGAHFLDFLALVGVHLQEPADALLLAAHRVVDGIARVQHAGVHADERELADVGVGHDLERETREGLVVAGLAQIDFAVLLLALDRGNINRRRQVVDHRPCS